MSGRDRGPAAVFGLPAPHRAHIAAALARTHTVFCVTATDTGAASASAIVSSLGIPSETLLPRETPLVHVRAASQEREAQRVRALTLLTGEAPVFVAASVAACMQALAPHELFEKTRMTVSVGETREPRDLLDALTRAGYERVELVEGRGQLAARGDILDIYPVSDRYPIRIEFFGDEIDQMRRFDPVTQRAIEQIHSCTLPPAYETPQPPEAMRRALKKLRGAVGFSLQELAFDDSSPTAGADVLIPLLFEQPETVFDYLPDDAILIVDEAILIDEAARTEQLRFGELISAMLERGEGLKEQGGLLFSASEILERLNTGRTVLFYALTRTHAALKPKEVIDFPARPAPQYLTSFDELARDIAHWRTSGERVVLCAGPHAERVQSGLSDNGAFVGIEGSLTALPEPGTAVILRETLEQGFAYPTLRLTVLSPHELFGKQDRPLKRSRKKSTLVFSELKVGDYIVHEAHGIGRFVRVEPLSVDGSTRDYLLIEYRGGDRLYIPTDQLDRIEKYIGGGDEDVAPPLSKLGGNEWEGRVNRAKAAAKKLAVDLSALYAARLQERGFAFSPDSAMQKQLEERFPYEETPDQLQSILDIKADMEKPRPMDRLLCGDVGYGKTEVAIRAIFKAVQDSKQVAFLVPTTILAEQHFNTLRSRFADFPVRVACLSRFRPPKTRQETKKQLLSGEVDVVVGTHALLAKDVRFKDLGLLVIDEEQRFGVNHKEMIKALRRTVDVLTLTATPIPRTLNMSLSGIRDISVIETPPEERYPVQTFVLEYTDALLVEAISRELARGGQVYVVDNHVDRMESTAQRMQELLPEARILIANGQMPEQQLEAAMLDFLEKRADVLLCSTIIESGLDISNANTLIVIDADRMGLAQLYQLRGRVGRSARLGYAYFTVRTGKQMNEKAMKRLMAIREFTQFGAGFQLAMRDLEIRGAGSLLGAEQHGHISDVGYEYYTKLVRQAVDEAQGKPPVPTIDPNVDIPVDQHIPHDYIRSEVQRLKVYRRVADIDSEAAMLDVTEELIDRYGEPPTPVMNLMRVSLVKSYAARGWLESVSVRDGLAEMKFHPDAAIDGAKLLMAVSGAEGAQLVAANPPGIRLRLPKRSANEILVLLPPFLKTVMRSAASGDD